MEMRRSDSSGTDDDLPPSHSGPVVAGRGRLVANGKATTYNGGTKNIDHLVRSLEQDAYTAVLRAFGAQSEHITWAKELLMSDLRRELRVSDEQHRELLAKVAQDDSIRQIREWRESGDNLTRVHAVGNNNLAAPPVAAAASPAPPPKKKQKTGVVSQVTMPPPPTPASQTPAAPVPPKQSKKHSSTVPRGKNKGSSEKTSSQGGARDTSSQGRPPQMKRKDGHLDTQDRLVGQTLKVRWHEDNNFYEAVVKEYHQEDGTHTLVYDVGTENVTSERVDLSKMPPEDIQSNGTLERKAPAKNLHHQTFKRRDKTKKPVRLSAVDSLARQVEELERGADLNKIEQAKKLAKEQLESVMKALREVGESSDEDSDGGARHRDSYSRNMVAKSDDDNDRRHANGDRS